MKQKNFFISTAIPYVNAPPHIGHALELIQGDVLARYHRLRGAQVIFTNGTDENAVKNVQSAQKAGKPVKDFVDENCQRFVELSKSFGISNDDFIRTTEERHFKGAQELWKKCELNGDIYKKKYHGLYCVGCESFKTPKDLVDGLCPIHQTKPDDIEEENYFFKLSSYQDKLLQLIESGDLKITPASRKNEILEFIRQGLEDFSISRSRERAQNWGIPVPGDETQIMYVWFDALTNYINAVGYGSDKARFDSLWTEAYRAHVIGKDITRFHAIYWPAMLLSAGVAVPHEIFVHGFITVDGQKMSKTIGNVIDPFQVVEKYGSEVVRYFLLREIPSGDDGDFSYKNLEARYGSDLANGLGNLIQRVATLIETKLGGEIVYRSKVVSGDEVLAQILDDAEFDKLVTSFRLHDALAEIWKKVGLANAYVNNNKPWSMESADELVRTMASLVVMIHHLTYLLYPFIPETSQKISEVFGDKLEKEIPEDYKFVIKKGDVLFPRLK
jgi:methionyl-tRNA synthetase